MDHMISFAGDDGPVGLLKRTLRLATCRKPRTDEAEVFRILLDHACDVIDLLDSEIKALRGDVEA